MGISEAFAAKQVETVAIYESMGVHPTCTCTPYLVGNVPAYGKHIAWSESSAVVFANSVLGARTNREGGPSALAAAISGRTAAYGFHLDAQRRATHHVRVRCPVRTAHDMRRSATWLVTWWAMACPISPVSTWHPSTSRISIWDDRLDALKLMGAAMAASGAIALLPHRWRHARGAPTERSPRCRHPGGYRLSASLLCGHPQHAGHRYRPCGHRLPSHPRWSSSPHVADALRASARRCGSPPRQVREEGQSLGLVQAIESAGGQVVADGCVIVAPMSDLAYRTLATNSAKMATYAWSHAVSGRALAPWNLACVRP